MWLHDDEEMLDLADEQLQLRHERRVVAICPHQVVESEFRTLDAVTHTHMLHHRSISSESHVFMLVRHVDQCICIIQRAGCECDCRAYGAPNSLQITRPFLAVPHTKHTSKRSRCVDVECVVICHQLVVVREHRQHMQIV